MNSINEKYKHSALTSKIIKAAYNVHNELGSGFLEKIYHRAMVLELAAMGLTAEAEKALAIHFKGQKIGDHFVDILVENTVVVELKAIVALEVSNEAQLLNYLKATEIEVGLLINFGSSVTIKRMVL
jgi:GxxExxY protein